MRIKVTTFIFTTKTIQVKLRAPAAQNYSGKLVKRIVRKKNEDRCADRISSRIASHKGIKRNK